jgi:ABC-2 type transport system permease protein
MSNALDSPAVPEEGRPMLMSTTRDRLGPNGELRRFWNITLTLAKTEFKTRYFGSVLGYLWSLMRPLMLFGVLYLVFTHVVRFGKQIEHYPLKLLIAIVLWSYFAEATGQSLTSLVQRENLLRKVRFPPAAIPLSVGLTSAFNLILNLCVVVLFVAISGIAPTPSWLELVPLLALLFLITASVSILLSVLYVPFRDMAPIWEVATQMLFWGTPIIYVIETAPESVRKLLMMNPLAAIIEQARHAVIDPSAPSAAAASGGAARLLIPFALTAALLALSLVLYRRAEPTIAERL